MIGGRSYLNNFIFQTCSFWLNFSETASHPPGFSALIPSGCFFAWERLLSLQPDQPKESGRECRWESGVALRALGEGPRKPAMETVQVRVSHVKG